MGHRRPVRSGQSAAESTGEYWDAVFDALAASRRRLVIVVLYRQDRTAVETLATKIAAFERELEGADDDIDEEAVDRRERRDERRDRTGTGEGEQEGEGEIQTSLRHVHLPKLEDAQLIEWDRQEDVVSLAENRRTGDLERQLVRDVATRQFDRRVA